jgi:hypothetical protein
MCDHVAQLKQRIRRSTAPSFGTACLPEQVERSALERIGEELPEPAIDLLAVEPGITFAQRSPERLLIEVRCEAGRFRAEHIQALIEDEPRDVVHTDRRGLLDVSLEASTRLSRTMLRSRVACRSYAV